MCTLSQKDTVATTGKVDDVRRVLSNDAFCIQVSALKWILECQRGNGDSGRFGGTPSKLWVTEGVKINKSLLQDRNKHKHLQMTPRWDHLSGFRFPWRKVPQTQSGVWKKRAMLSGPWSDTMELLRCLRFFPEIDELKSNTDWLIHRLAECCQSAHSAVLSLDGTSN